MRFRKRQKKAIVCRMACYKSHWEALQCQQLPSVEKITVLATSLRKTNEVWYINSMRWCCWHIRIDEIKVITRIVKLKIYNFTLISFSGLNFTDDFVIVNWFNCVFQNSPLHCVCLHLFVSSVPRPNMNVHHWYTATYIHFYTMTNYVYVIPLAKYTIHILASRPAATIPCHVIRWDGTTGKHFTCE